MSDNSRIEWTDTTWNPVTGCTEISAGCKNCYAKKMAHRLKAMGNYKYRRGFEITTHEPALKTPSKWRKPRRVFVCSMGDLFHNDVPHGLLVEILETMRRAERHTFQVLTKRPARAAHLTLEWPRNVWAGVSVENDAALQRIDDLRGIKAAIKFVSFEPLLGSVRGFDLAGIDWAIAGGETGPRARPMNPDWARTIRDQCLEREIPFFFKRHGGRRFDGDDLLDGQKWSQMPSCHTLHHMVP